jgi:hypothetical protein
MAVKLEGKLEREIRIHGVEAPVLVEISPEGLSLRVKGSRTAVTTMWGQIVSVCSTPTNVKSYLMGRPLDVLVKAARERAERAVEKATE